MKTVILAGGFGTRISEETEVRPKPMIEVGGKPLLWHIMKIYASHGLTDFVICLGYKAYYVKEYFANYFLHNADVTLHLAENRVEVHSSASEPWSVTLVDTGLHTQTGGRLKRIASYLDPEEPFCMTYGDGVADVDITQLIGFARQAGTLATVTAIQPAGRFGALELDGDKVTAFREKPTGANWMNGGFFVLSPKVLDFIEGDQTPWEHSPMEELARRRELTSYLHRGFWQPVDTLRDKRHLEKLWEEGSPPWKTWN
ncbi:MAG: glucose-1-phosphate cytidylyltransferase [Vulcanimicrobiota bacterium]